MVRDNRYIIVDNTTSLRPFFIYRLTKATASDFRNSLGDRTLKYAMLAMTYTVVIAMIDMTIASGISLERRANIS